MTKARQKPMKPHYAMACARYRRSIHRRACGPACRANSHEQKSPMHSVRHGVACSRAGHRVRRSLVSRRSRLPLQSC